MKVESKNIVDKKDFWKKIVNSFPHQKRLSLEMQISQGHASNTTGFKTKLIRELQNINISKPVTYLEPSQTSMENVF